MSDALDEFLRRREQAPQNAARTAIRAPAPPPDQAADAARTSRETGVGYPIVAAQPDLYRKNAQQQQAEYTISRSPKLAGWLTARESNAPVAQGAVPKLGQVEHHITTREQKPTWDRKLYDWIGFPALIPTLFTRGSEKIAAGGRDVREEGLSPSKVGNALLAGGGGVVGSYYSTEQAIYEVQDKYSPLAWAERAMFGTSSYRAAGQRSAQQVAEWKQYADYTRPTAKTSTVRGIYSGFESLPMTGVGLLGGAYYRSAKIGAGLVSGMVGAGSYSEGRKAGLSVEGSLAYGGADAAVEYFTEVGPLGRLLGDVGSGKKFGSRLLEMFASDVPGEQIATVGQDFNRWGAIEVNQGKSFTDYLKERPDAAYQTLVASMVGSTTAVAATSAAEFSANKMGRNVGRILPAEDNAHFLNVLGQLSAANEVLARDGETFEDFIRHASEGSTATDVYVDAAKLGEIFQQANLTPEEAHNLTGLTPDEIKQAVEQGDDIRIPIEQFAGRVAQSAVGDQLIPHLRLDPQDMSVEEAKVFLQGAKEEFAATAERALADSQTENTGRASRDNVHAAILGELTKAGRFNTTTNDVYASVVANFYAAFGARLGKTAEELASEVALRVQSGETAQPSFDQPTQPASVNIGLDIPGGGKLDPQQARDALAAMGVTISNEAIQQSDSESTLVAELSQPLTAEQLGALSEALGQEAIAQHLGDGTGMLEGPGKANWGDFNPEFYLNLDGSRLAKATDPVAVFFQESANLAGHNPSARYMAINDGTPGPFNSQEADPRGAGSEPGLTLDIASAAVANGGVVELQGEFFPGVDLGLDPNESIGGESYIEMDDGTERPVHNADGDAIASTKTAVRAFWNWFGDSEMVDSDGRPLVFYHGTKAPFTGANAISKREFAFADDGNTIFFATGTNGYKTAKGFVQNNAPTEEGVLRAYLRAERVDEYDADGRMWDEVIPVDYDEVLDAQQQWIDDAMADFEPSAYLEQTGDGEWSLVGPEPTPKKFDDEDEANDALEEAHDAERKDREEELREEADEFGESDLVEMGYLGSTGTSTDGLAAQAMDRYDAVLISDVDEGSGATTVAIILGEPKNVKAIENQGTFDPEDPRIFYQSGQTDPLSAFKRESFYPTRATRLADGTVVASGVPDFYPDRLAKIAEQLGAKAVVPVNDNDKRLNQGVPLWHTTPPIESDGTIRLDHWGTPGIERTDPARWGESGTLPNSERGAISTGLPRTYFGIASGQPGGYVVEFPGRAQYQANVPAEALYDIGKDPAGFKQDDGVAALEKRIKAAGYLGYWSNNGQLGLVATVFEPLSVKTATAYNQDAVFFSALERAVERSTQAKASGPQWAATLKKTPGVKQEELDWTAILDFLADVEGPVTREAILELVRGGGVQVDEVVLGPPPIEEIEDKFWVRFGPEGMVRAFDTRVEAEDFAQQNGIPVQFVSWSSDPSNPTYRELLITLPGGVAGNPARAPSTHWDTDHVVAHARFMDKVDADGNKVLFVEEVQSDWHQKGRDQGYQQPVDPKVVAEAEQAYWAAEAIESVALAALYPHALAYRAQRRATMPEEALAQFDIQYGSPENSEPVVARDLPQYLSELQALGQLDFAPPEALAAFDAVVAARESRELRGRELDVAKGLITNGGIPNAPFKTTWPALVMKRMIRWAAEHGYQKIAWTTGQQQAERYNLSEAVGGEMTVQPMGNGTEVIFGFPEQPRVADRIEESGNGTRMSNHGEVAMTREQAVAVMGTDFGGRAFDMGIAGADVVDVQSFSVGGEGMKAFYDRNLVNITNDLIKKHGAKVSGVAVSEFGGLSGTAQVFRNLARAKSEARQIVGPTDAPNGWTSASVEARMASWTPEAVAERLAANRKVITDNIENLTEAIENPNAPDRIEAAVPGYKSRLAERQAELIRFDSVPAEAREKLRVERLAELARARDMLLEAENMETPPDKTTNPGFDITPELAEAAMGGFPLFQKTGAPRGQIAFGADITQVPSMISLLRGADLSTFLHETGHFFFETLNHYASQPGAPADVVADRDAMLRYIGVESVTEWENMTPEARRNGHETVARSFEAYLFEGRAPSIEMRVLFQTLRKWLRSVYTSLTQLKVELTDEVRGVFDRMLASEDAIQEAQADLEMFPAQIDKPEGVSDTDWAELQKLNTDATAEAAQQLERRSLRDMRYAGRATAREVKRLQGEVADKRKAMREEVAPEIEAMPVYQAIKFLRSGKVDGVEEAEEFHRLSTPDVRVILQLEDGEPLPKSLSGMTSTQNGLNPEQAAELLGYTSADHLVKDLLFASPLKDAIEAETDSRMRERYGELNSPEAIQEAANAAVHNDVRGRFVATELAIAQKAPGKKRVLDGAARRLASEMVARLRIRDLRPSQYEAAERRAARAAQKAGTTDLDAFVREKRNQLFQFHAAKAAHAARDEVKAARDYLTKFGNANTRKALDVDYLDQIDKIMERYDLKQVSNVEADRRKSLKSWIEQQEAMGFTPMLDEETLEEIGRKPWRELTVEEMRDLLDGIKNIEFLARKTKQMLSAIDKANLDDAAAEVGETIRNNAYQELEENIDRKTWWEGVKSGVDDFFAMHRKFANTIHVFDGNKYGGIAWERFIRGMNAAGDNETTRNVDAGSRLQALFAQVDNTSTKLYLPEIGKSLSLEARLMVALNWGNEINRNRILDGDKWSLEQVDAILNTLDASHWDFVEGVWAFINSYKGEIIAKERRVSGIIPAMVEAEPFQHTMPDGSLRMLTGGYFPIKYDPDRSTKAEQHLAADIAQAMMRGAFTRATTRRGHLKERVDTVKRPVRKDFGVIFEHTSQVIHDLSWHEYLIDANRLIAHGAVDSAVREHYGPPTLRWMRKALEDIAAGDVGAANALERGLTYIRSGASIAGLGWNLWTSLLQPIGLTQSWSRIGAKHVGRGIAELFGTPAQMNAKAQWIYEVSPFMRSRGDTMQREINEIRNQVSPKSPLRQTVEKAVPAAAVDVVADSYFVLIAKAQLIADLPTWLGQYHKSLDAGEGADRAVKIADQAVIDSQGSGLVKDLAGVQRGGPWQKLWTNFYSYFSATYNLMADRTAELRRVGPKDLPYFAIDIALLSLVPATLSSLLHQLLKGDDDDDGEDIAKKVAADNLNYTLGLMLGSREVGGAISGMAGYTGPAGARVFVELGKFGKQAGQGEIDEPLLRSVNSLAGVLLHYPSGQVDRTVRGLRDFSNGDAGPMAPLVGPPAKK